MSDTIDFGAITKEYEEKVAAYQKLKAQQADIEKQIRPLKARIAELDPYIAAQKEAAKRIAAGKAAAARVAAQNKKITGEGAIAAGEAGAAGE